MSWVMVKGRRLRTLMASVSWRALSSRDWAPISQYPDLVAAPFGNGGGGY